MSQVLIFYLMIYKVVYFQTNNHNPIEELLLSLDSPTYSKSLKTINLLEKYGLIIGMPYVKKVNKNLYELRVRGKIEIRILFAHKYNVFYLLHGFKKKRQKLLSKDIMIAENRLNYI